MNWYWPDETSVTPLREFQLLSASERFVVASTLNAAPGVLVKANRKEPSASCCVPVEVISVTGGPATNARLCRAYWCPLCVSVVSLAEETMYP